MSQRSERVSNALDAFSRGTGHAVAWLTLFMVITTFAIVVLRHLFDVGFIWMQESLIWMHSAVFMLGAAYTLQQEEHVRVDIFYRSMSDTRRAWVNLLGVLIFIFPLCGFFFLASQEYVLSAWALHEHSRDAGGLFYPAIPLLKSVLLLMPIAVGLQGLSLLLKSLRRIRA